ncbi:hypothetical protein CORT_0C02610 [Candida orthopsilosis Co 90-125]|uniref:AB hydrolase-1 domain-containing protein n=1 Tax=Candida orthopsilosis (strain 90-125) TaxID=1136231 RepID=H8X2T9_CANO9|nr:hypothetical protein CORT_0C02610 [Candida orthopsilosis Co 90-125]CCG25636.1 hypothetical protein CORT_0C02610 [Candida orthopsilosis Co 90-125]
MTSLIQTSIEAMGNPNTTNKEHLSSSSESSVDSTSEPKPTKALVNSIPIFQSIQDWWSSSSELKREHGTVNKEDKKFREALLKNRKVEYDLFRAVLPDDIYIESPVAEDTNENKSSCMRGKLLDVELKDESFIHEFYLENTDPGPERHIVIIHGYMAALGYFIKNIESLIKTPGIRIHLIDLPGFGNSARPKFPRQFLTKPTKKRQQIEQILEIENWFIDKIENWRLIRNIANFKLIAHSMGAYLSCCYVMKYNNQGDTKIVSDLILVSPMGTESNEHSLINDERYNINLHYASDPLRELQFEENDKEVVISPEFTKAWELVGKPKFPKSSVLQKLWENNKSPFDLLQKTGPFYSKLISYWSFARFKNFSDSEDAVDLIYKLHGYSFSIFNQYQASGELAITKLINHEILARLPLCDRGFVDFLVDNNINTLWLYGDKDWMNSKGGEYIFKKISEKNDTITEFKVVENAGHHIYLDNPQAFNTLVLDFFNLYI